MLGLAFGSGFEGFGLGADGRDLLPVREAFRKSHYDGRSGSSGTGGSSGVAGGTPDVGGPANVVAGCSFGVTRSYSTSTPRRLEEKSFFRRSSTARAYRSDGTERLAG